jgi:ATP-dependent Clp protease ATP-binding subunit ClpC
MTDEAREFIVEKGNATEYGARPLRRAVENYIEDPLAEELLKGSFEGNNRVTVVIKEVGEIKHLEFEASNSEPEAQLAVAGEVSGEAAV